ncbi:MAG: small basic protein [Planctomycetota bacterium]|nr:small basic protein [Planctomycetota bacterium]
MSIHSSLRQKKGQTSNRSVYSRWERLEMLKEAGRWSAEEQSVFGLPKVRTKIIKKKAKKKAKAE